jgi:IclR family transcriptional regulator, acetate operon repressor
MAAKGAKTLDSPAAKVLAALAAIARHKAVAVSAIAQYLDLPLPTAHRICAELERLGYVRRVPGTRHWTVARPFVDVAADAIAAAAGDAVIDAVLVGVTNKIGEMCSFAVQVGDEVVYVASTEAPHGVTLSFHAGRRAPLFCTSSGRLFLSALDETELESYLAVADFKAFTPFTVTSRKNLVETIRRVRRQGYAITSQEYVLHVVGTAVPVRTREGRLYGAVSVAAPDVRMNPKSLRGILPLLYEAADRLVATLGLPGERMAGSRIAKAGAKVIADRSPQGH